MGRVDRFPGKTALEVVGFTATIFFIVKKVHKSSDVVESSIELDSSMVDQQLKSVWLSEHIGGVRSSGQLLI